jgi:ABC-type dipeptide/oligopeptide/nickel transport system ATPase subunit
MLSATSVTHAFGAVPVLDGVDLCLAPGEIVGPSGASGAGKSTLGRILAGQLQPTAGRVEIDGAPLAPRPGRASPVQYAPQLSELSVDPRRRIAQVLRNGGCPDPEALRILGVRPEWGARFPAELSGGRVNPGLPRPADPAIHTISDLRRDHRATRCALGPGHGVGVEAPRRAGAGYPPDQP